MKEPIIFKPAQTQQDLEQILQLQHSNYIHQLSSEKRRQQGFVTVKHDIHLLSDMNNTARQIIATVGDIVVGYALVMVKEFKDMIPVLVPMFEMFEKISYKGKPLTTYNYYVMGQICIAEDYRGQGLFDQLYFKQREIYSKEFNLCLTEISISNTRSMKAHERIGFKTIKTYRDETDEWNIVLWDWEEHSVSLNPHPIPGNPVKEH